MTNDESRLKQHGTKKAASGGAHKAPYNTDNHKHVKAHSHRLPAAESDPVAPRSIEDVARLFIGDGAALDELVKENSINARRSQSATKRPRDDASADVPRKASKRDEKKAAAIKSKDSSKTDHSASATTRLSSSASVNSESKEGKKLSKQKIAELDGEGNDDVALSHAVQAQALSFLRQLNPQKSKTFWGLRDVAQGKRAKADHASTLSLSSSAASLKEKGNRRKKSKTTNSTLADAGEELWRVGGPYTPSNEAGEEEKVEKCYHKGQTQQRRDGRKSSEDDYDDSSATSSEPSWVTDSSEEDSDGDDESAEEEGPNSNSDDNKAVTGVAKADKGSCTMQKGGGRLFQSGDDIWDDEDD